MNFDPLFYKGKKVLVTGHTGFKGTWLCRMLMDAGAVVTGYSLEPPAVTSLFDRSGLQERMDSNIFHLAAQPLVRDSYRRPHYTYETNVMGTVNVLECVRQSSSVKSVLNVTTDKVYHNREWCWGYREDEALDGFDPYSNSKSCSELVTGVVTLQVTGLFPIV